MWTRVADMEIIRAIILTAIRGLANFEFQVESKQHHFFRRAYLKYMQVHFGEYVSIGREVYLRNRGSLRLGERCAIGSFTRIWNYAPIVIGDDFLSAGGLTINSATHDPINLESEGRPVTIGNRVWCGQNVTILGGVTIGDDVVIGACSLVMTDIPSNSIAVGVPAKVIKSLVREKQILHPLFQRSP